MIINFTFIRLIILLSLVFVFPLIQKQWSNLYLFNIKEISFYTILYYLSGVLFPVLVIYNSLSRFTNYKICKENLNKIIIIRGRILLLVVLFTLILLSSLALYYLNLNLDLILHLFLSNSNYASISNIIYFYLIFVTSIFLIFEKTRIYIKKFILFNYFINALLIWHSQINDISIANLFFVNKVFNLDNLNYVNIFFLLIIESIYYVWSLISYKNNLSNWRVELSITKLISNISEIGIFYFIVIIYYSILKQ